MKEPKLLQIDQVAVADVDASGRLRPVSEAATQSLIQSITELGVMKDAIHVRKRKDGRMVLIAGAHRLEAAKRLGWEVIPAKVWTEVTDDWARLMEVDDNIAGAELNPLDTAVFLATRKAIYEKLHPETRRGVAGGLARQGLASDMMSFAEATAEKFGLSKRHVERLVAAGSKLGPNEVRQLRDAPRAVGLKDLMEIARIGDPVERYDVVDMLAAGRAKSAGEARRIRAQAAGGIVAPPKDPVEDAFNRLVDAWSRAPMAAKKRFLLEHRKEVWEAQNKGAALADWRSADDAAGGAEAEE